MDDVAQPQLYEDVQILRSDEHADLRLRRDADYRFAAEFVSVPVALTEMPALQRHYPIVFAGSGARVPVAVLGFSKEGGNLFVGVDGSWEADLPIPSFFRRYPMIALNVKSGPEIDAETGVMLAADLASDKISATEGTAFFKGGKPTKASRALFSECARLQRDFELAAELGKFLTESGVLHTRSVELNIKAVGHFGMKNFELIDEEKMNALPVDTLAAWREKRLLAGIYAQLMSLGAWQSLGRREMARVGGDTGR